MPSPVDPFLQTLDTCAEPFDYIAYVSYFVVFILQLVDLPDYFSEAGDFCVGGGDGGGSTGRLVGDGALSLRCKL